MSTDLSKICMMFTLLRETGVGNTPSAEVTGFSTIYEADKYVRTYLNDDKPVVFDSVIYVPGPPGGKPIETRRRAQAQLKTDLLDFVIFTCGAGEDQKEFETLSLRFIKSSELKPSFKGAFEWFCNMAIMHGLEREGSYTITDADFNNIVLVDDRFESYAAFIRKTSQHPVKYPEGKIINRIFEYCRQNGVRWKEEIYGE